MMLLRLVLVVIAVTGASLPASAMEWHWLEQMRVAVQQTDYRGEFVHRRGDTISAYSIVHRYDQGKSLELLQQLDGDMIEVFREGEELVCFYPEGSSSSMNHPIPAAPFSQVYELDLDRISDSYMATTVGEERVAGYIARVVLLSADQWRYSQKLWLEKDTGLLLQSEMLDTDGKVLEQFRFTRLEINAEIAESELQPKLEGSAQRQQSTFRMKMNQPDDESFNSQLTWLPEGFQLTHAFAGMQADKWTERRSYSDGLTSFTVFVEKGMAMKNKTSLAKMGATNALMAEQSGYAITVVGEIPTVTAKKLATQIEVTAWAM
ncbi:MucB/RseB C-terminal domain-containing protein [Reinekea marinisedimentorum]|uniref:Sigma-E factor negative regulatory protein RseB n=1 Tax=Reinekea marinisedimentorum TaxID=230495 RepID=A0A4R3I414_9GAMM|nr:MucB/RseB C-terminal domain-containing protein [Reinekea marinisedimentorum]TCS39803.1 sigma-E factor negative regulatory protein RseB [Reinekea marinisedimentorum]